MKNRIVLTVSLLILSAPCVAQEVKIGPDRYAVALRRTELQSNTPAAARRSLARIDRAVMAICGASNVSLSEAKWAIRHSSCWREGMNDALRQIGDPYLSRAWQDQ
ncbi:UrcA family protein [Sphingomonas sp.]|uniref:UrcA family protein n=1 Tax=Sphingomonas sp. TaxID=28214 RepID=UPI0031D6DEBA